MFSGTSSWGFATLHPRLYALVCSQGFSYGLTEADALGEAFAAGDTDALGEGEDAGETDGEAAAIVPGFATGVPPWWNKPNHLPSRLTQMVV